MPRDATRTYAAEKRRWINAARRPRPQSERKPPADEAVRSFYRHHPYRMAPAKLIVQ